MSTAHPTKAKKEKEIERREKISQPPQTADRLKTVVRRLPPNLPEDVFWQTVSPWVTNETITWKIYCAGKPKKRMNKENVPSRAYIAFKNEEQLAKFSQGFDGHLFRDKAGNESYAIVEFAPYQKIPSEKRKPDNRNGTIEKDEDYISFLESLKSAQSDHVPVTLEALIAAARPPSPPKTTPLLEALKAEKTAQKDKEAILRNHAHYKDQLNVNAGASRKDEKKKGALANAASVQAQKATELPTPATALTGGSGGPGKKGKKGKETRDSGGQSQGQKHAPSAAPNANAIAAVPTKPVSGKASANINSGQGQPPKPARHQRQPQQAKASTAAAREPVVPVITTALSRNPATAASTASTSAVNPAGPNSPATPDTPSAPRRSRPVIGLASRQFEAALSGVSGGERKSRRERERERESGAAVSTAEGVTTVQPTAGSIPSIASTTNPSASNAERSKLGLPTSPRRDRNRRGAGGSGGGSAVAAIALGGEGSNAKPTNMPPPVKVPSILHRTDPPAPMILQRDGTAIGGGGQIPPPAQVQGGGARGGPRRGRGRGGSGGRGGGSAPRGG